MKALVLSSLLASSVAFAAGAVIDSKVLPPDAAAKLEQEISAARLRHPGAFTNVESVHRQLAKLDEGKRGRMAPLVSHLGRL